jgi:hypothetical protein
MKFSFKIIGTFVLLLALLCQWNSVLLPVLQYEWNSDQENLSWCINLDKTQMDCRGKCHRNQQVEHQLFEVFQETSSQKISLPVHSSVEGGTFVLNTNSLVVFCCGAQSLLYLNEDMFYQSRELEITEPPPRFDFMI